MTTQPSLPALMIEGLRLTRGEHVLEIGTGYGFRTAVLAMVAADVVSVERWREELTLARFVRLYGRHGYPIRGV